MSHKMEKQLEKILSSKEGIEDNTNNTSKNGKPDILSATLWRPMSF